MNGWSTMGLPPERTCAICKKTFCARDDWAYVRGKDNHRRFFCSWHCLSEFDKRGENIKGRKPSKHKDDIIRLLREGKTPIQIAKELGIGLQLVYYYDRQYGGL